ncbi:MAG: hypothetical protein V4622_01025 [Bacteroidota bacterium]
MKFPLVILLFSLVSCNSILNQDELSKSDLERLKTLNLLDEDEKIIKFYSEYKNSVAGNFYTNKRLASYWLDENDESKNDTNCAFYEDIAKLDTVVYAGATFSPYIKVICNDSSSFKVCFDGEKEEIRKTFLDIIAIWKKSL